MSYIVYILQNPEGIFYKGFTENLEKRLFEHNSGMSKYTSKSIGWKLVYSKSFETKKEALIEEKRIKKLNHKSLLKLISENSVG